MRIRVTISATSHNRLSDASVACGGVVCRGSLTFDLAEAGHAFYAIHHWHLYVCTGSKKGCKLV